MLIETNAVKASTLVSMLLLIVLSVEALDSATVLTLEVGSARLVVLSTLDIVPCSDIGGAI